MNLNDDTDVSQLRMRFFDIAEEPRRMLPPIQGFEKVRLVPLEEAVKPLVKHVYNIEHYASIAKENCNLPADGLSSDESASIRLYTMEWKPPVSKQNESPNQCLYVVLNKTLRDENRNLLKDWFLYLKLIISSLSKMPSIPRRLFRGVKLNLSEQYPEGQKPVWWAFSSCADSVEVLEKLSFYGKTGTRTLFEIDCYSGKDIRQHSAYPNESEVLLLPARQLQIVSSLDKGNGLHIIHLKEIKPDFPLIGELQITNASSPISANQVKLMPFPVNALPPKTTAPQPISSSFPIDATYHNSDLERDIARVQPRSNMNFDGKRLTDGDMKIVVDQAIAERQCRVLSLQNNELTSQGISTLAKGIRESTTLEELNLSNNRLSDQDLLFLAKELSVNQTTTVEQWKCCGIAKLKTLDKAPIKILNLSHNNIGDEGVKHLAEVLRVKRTLIQLHLNDNRINDSGVQLLADALCDPRTNLTHLYLSNNRLTNLSVGYLTNMLNQNRSLTTLWLIDCNLTNADKEQLRQAVASKRNFRLIVDPSY